MDDHHGDDAGEIEELIRKVRHQDPETTEVLLDQELEVPVTEDRMIRLIEASKRNPRLQKFRIGWEGEDDRPDWLTTAVCRSLASLFRITSTIKHVSLPHGIRNDELAIVAEGLHVNTTVDDLELHDSEVSGGFPALLVLNRTIESLDLKGSELGSDGAASLAQALGDDRCKLKRLHLEMIFNGETIRIVCEGLQRNGHVKVLSLGDNDIDFAGLGSIVDMARSNSHLECLFINNNCFNSGRTAGTSLTAGALLARALRHNTSVKSLDISGCELTGDDLSLVYEAMGTSNRTTWCLVTENNWESATSIEALARHLPDMTGLDALRFSWCEGRSLALVHNMLRGLAECETLTFVQGDFSSEDEGGEELESLWHAKSLFYTARNNVRRLLVRNPPAHSSSSPVSPRERRAVPLGLWPRVLEWCNNPFHSGRRRTTARDDQGEASLAEVRASLAFYALRSRANDTICSRVAADGGSTNKKRPRS